MKEATISLFLDTRRALKNDIFPVKLRVYYGKAKLYDTGTSLTKEEFEQSYMQPNPRGRFRQLQADLKSVESSAISVVKELRKFSFEQFERKLFTSKFNISNVIDHYESYIDVLDKEERIGTKSNYQCSLNSIKLFAGLGKRQNVEHISFESITPEFLNKYERWMLNAEKSKTTVGVYLRPLRKIFNLAIEKGDISVELYPFKKYTIPTGKNIKKNLESDVLKSLFNARLENEGFLEKARDFWFFSYVCNGMNFRDIAELRYKNIGVNSFSFLRHKTINTTKDDPKPIIVPMTEFVKNFIKRYGTKSSNPNDYVFPILKPGLTAQQRHRTNQNFIRFVNQHMETLCKNLDIPHKIGTMYARHTFTTKVAREIGLEFAQEALGHTTLATTQNYWAGFEKDTKMEMADKLLDF